MGRGVWVAGAVLMGVSVVMPFLIFAIGAASDDIGGMIAGWIFAFIVSPLLFITGLVLLIVGLASGGQQQQQQVVVVTGGGKSCPRCRHQISSSDRFCNGCGARIL